MRLTVHASRVLISAVCLHAVSLAAAAPAVLSVQVRQEGDPAPLPCRAWVEAGGERLFRPLGRSCTPYARDRSFSCDGRFDIEVPPGRAVVHIERGKEYVPFNQPVNAEEGRTTEVAIALRRWIDMPKRGWYSADLHVHLLTEDRKLDNLDRFPGDALRLKQMALADDVHLLPAFSYWNENVDSWPKWPEGPVMRVDDTHVVTLANEEIERIGPRDGPAFESLGAPLFFGLTRPVYAPRKDETYPCNAALCRIARKTSPSCVIDNDKALWAENVVGAALGLFDCTQLCHNHYHRDATLRMGWGMIGADPEEQKTDWSAREVMSRTNRIYYRWLNCGFRMAATGGSAIGVMPVPMGHSRTYAKLDGSLSQEAFLDAIRAGRTFATTGPMLILTVDGKGVGASIDWSSGGSPLQVRVELDTLQTIESLEVIHNGEILDSADVGGPARRTYDHQTSWIPRRSGWVAARAAFRCSDGSVHQAHTSPVYIAVDRKPTAFRKDAEYMIRWIHRILQISGRPKRYRSEQDRAESQAIFREALAVYEKIARSAAEVWND